MLTGEWRGGGCMCVCARARACVRAHVRVCARVRVCVCYMAWQRVFIYMAYIWQRVFTVKSILRKNTHCRHERFRAEAYVCVRARVLSEYLCVCVNQVFCILFRYMCALRARACAHMNTYLAHTVKRRFLPCCTYRLHTHTHTLVISLWGLVWHRGSKRRARVSWPAGGYVEGVRSVAPALAPVVQVQLCLCAEPKCVCLRSLRDSAFSSMMPGADNTCTSRSPPDPRRQYRAPATSSTQYWGRERLH